MSQSTNQPVPSGSYRQEYHTIVINTPISGPIPTTTSDGESHPPFVKPSFIQGSSPASTTSKFSWVSNFLLSHCPSTSHIKKSYSNDSKIYPLKDIWHQQQTPMNDQRSNSWRPSLLACMNSTTCWMNQIDKMFLSKQSTLWEVIMTFWAAGGILIFDHYINMAIRLETEAETQQITAKNLFGRLQLLKIDEKLQPIIIAEWGRILQQTPILWPKSHPKCPNPNQSQFPPWNSYIINNHNQLHPLLWSLHLILRNHSSQPQALWNIQHHQPMTLHCFQFLHPLCFKFPHQETLTLL